MINEIDTVYPVNAISFNPKWDFSSNVLRNFSEDSTNEN